MGLSNKKKSLLEETIPTKVKIEPRIEIKSGEEIENKEIKEENLPQKCWLKNVPKKSLPEGNEEEETQDEISAPSKEELTKTKLELKVSTDDNNIDDEDMTSEKDMDPQDKKKKL